MKRTSKRNIKWTPLTKKKERVKRTPKKNANKRTYANRIVNRPVNTYPKRLKYETYDTPKRNVKRMPKKEFFFFFFSQINRLKNNAPH